MSGIVKGLFGGRSKAEKILSQFQPAGFSSPGLTGSFDKKNNTFRLRRGGERRLALNDLREGFENRVAEFRGLRDRVTPGFGDVTKARVDSIRRAGRRAVGDLTEELSQRRVAGSSFAVDRVAGVESEFAQLEERARAEGALQELGVTIDLVNEETAAAVEGASEILRNLNFEDSLAAGLSTAVSQMMQANNAAMAGARASSEAGAAEFIGTLASAFLLKP